MPDAQSVNKPSPRETLPRCPMCQAHMKVLHVVTGRPGFEHWTLRCETCGLVHETQTAADPINSEA
jgi:uncharacterized Zn finger protein